MTETWAPIGSIRLCHVSTTSTGSDSRSHASQTYACLTSLFNEARGRTQIPGPKARQTCKSDKAGEVNHVIETFKRFLFLNFFTGRCPKKVNIFRLKSGKFLLSRTGTGTGNWSRISGRNRTLPEIRSVPSQYHYIPTSWFCKGSTITKLIRSWLVHRPESLLFKSWRYNILK